MLIMPFSQHYDAPQQKYSVLLRDLWRHAPLSKVMLTQRNGLTEATVSATPGLARCSNVMQIKDGQFVWLYNVEPDVVPD